MTPYESQFKRAITIFKNKYADGFTIDKDNRTITMSETYTYDADMIAIWKTQIQQYEETYLATLQHENPDYEMVENDRLIFVEIYKWIDMIQGIIS